MFLVITLDLELVFTGEAKLFWASLFGKISVYKRLWYWWCFNIGLDWIGLFVSVHIVFCDRNWWLHNILMWWSRKKTFVVGWDFSAGTIWSFNIRLHLLVQIVFVFVCWVYFCRDRLRWARNIRWYATNSSYGCCFWQRRERDIWGG